LFIVGLVYSLAHAYKQKRFILAMPVLLLLPGLVPNIMSGFGIPDLLEEHHAAPTDIFLDNIWSLQSILLTLYHKQ